MLSEGYGSVEKADFLQTTSARVGLLAAMSQWCAAGVAVL